MTQTQTQWYAQWLRRLRPGTFRARITLVMTLLALVMLALVDASVYAGRLNQRRNNLDAVLMNVAQTEAATFADSIEKGLRASAAHTHELHIPTGAVYETYVQIEDNQGRVLARTPNLEPLPSLGLNDTNKKRVQSRKFVFEDIQIGPRSMRCLYFPIVSGGQSLIARIAVSEEPLISGMRALAILLLSSLVLGGLAFALASSRLSLRLTRPLEQIAAFARSVEEANLHARIPEISQDAELRDVTGVLNEMLDRLETAFTQQQALILAQQRFVADASHELRSPLTNLHGTVEVALRRPRTAEDYQETLELSLTEIQRLSRLVEDLLTLSRADAGQFPLDLQSCDLGEIARSAAKAVVARAEQNSVFLQIIAPEPTPVYGDRDRLRQVVDNILDNALKYSPSGTAVEIRAHCYGQERRLEIRDHGPGITPADAERIFHRFYRTDLSRTRASGGAGLGLAIAQAITHAHGGKITVETAPGAGTQFCVHLPAISNIQALNQESFS